MNAPPPTGVLTLQRRLLGWTATYRPLTTGRPRVVAWRPFKFAAAAAALAHLCPIDRAGVTR